MAKTRELSRNTKDKIVHLYTTKMSPYKMGKEPAEKKTTVGAVLESGINTRPQTFSLDLGLSTASYLVG